MKVKLSKKEKKKKKKKKKKTPELEKSLQDVVPEIKARDLPVGNKKPALLGKVPDPAFNYHSLGRSGRTRFAPAEYDLAEINRIQDTDSYVAQSFNKKTALMFKEGYDLVGPNPTTVRYVRARLRQIAAASGIPTEKLLRDIGGGLIRKSNVSLAKVRNTEKSGGRNRVKPGTNRELKPVAGYFVLPAETMEFEMIGNRISAWQQRTPHALITQRWNIDDVIHFFYDRKEGFVFGTPVLIPVIDDVRALRKIEENIELLVYQHLFPLFQYKVGTETMPAGLTESGEDEIDLVRREIQFMPSEGGIVTPERHEIKAIGAEGRALRAESYLEHFKKRVFSGLGISAVDMGEPDTSNKSTADNMSRNLVDSVKDYQRTLELFFNKEIINELLLESTFGEEVLDEDNLVYLQFKEIDVSTQIKKEEHAANLFAKDMIDHDEARRRVGYEPWLLPSPEEVQEGNDHPDKYPQWHRSRWKLFELPKLLIQAIDEPWSMAAKAAIKERTVPVGQVEADESTAEGLAKEVALEKEKAKNKPKPVVKKKKDAVIKETFLEIKNDLVGRLINEKKYDKEWLAKLIETQMNTVISRIVTIQLLEFKRGYSLSGSTQTQQFMESAVRARELFTNRTTKYVSKLTRDIKSSLNRNINISTSFEDMPSIIRAVFDSLEFRTNFIEETELAKAKSIGFVKGAQSIGITTLYPVSTKDSDCNECKLQTPLDIQIVILMDEVAPYHPGCKCIYSLNPPNTEIKQNNSVIEDAKGTKSKLGPKSHAASFLKCKQRALAKLREMHPDLDDDSLEARAEASCLSHLID